MLLNIYEFRENRHKEGRTFLKGKLRVIYIDLKVLNPNMANKMPY